MPAACESLEMVKEVNALSAILGHGSEGSHIFSANILRGFNVVFSDAVIHAMRVFEGLSSSAWAEETRRR